MKSRTLLLAVCVLVAGIDLPRPFSGRLSARDVPPLFQPIFEALPPLNAPIDRSAFGGLSQPNGIPDSTFMLSADGKLIIVDVRDGRVITEFSPLGPAFRDPVSFAITSLSGGDAPDTVLAGPARPSDRPLVAFRLLPALSSLGETPDPWIAAGGLRVAAADVDADPTPELIFSSGPGGPGSVSIVSLGRGEAVGFGPFGPDFPGGVFVAAGDVNGDGKAEIVTTQENGGELRIFDAVGGEIRMRAYARPFGENYNNGVRAAVGDVNGDGVADLLVSRIMGPAHVRAFSLTGPEPTVVADFLAFEQNLPGGVFVAAGSSEGQPFVAASSGNRVQTFRPDRDGTMRAMSRGAATFQQLTEIFLGMFTPRPAE